MTQTRTRSAGVTISNPNTVPLLRHVRFRFGPASGAASLR
jgi:hypothetical protein